MKPFIDHTLQKVHDELKLVRTDVFDIFDDGDFLWKGMNLNPLHDFCHELIMRPELLDFVFILIQLLVPFNDDLFDVFSCERSRRNWL